MAGTRRPSLGRDNATTRRVAARLKRQARVCALCGLPIDPELKAPHPYSFTVDHIIPLSMGGAVADPSNMRPAHRLCNMQRGTGRSRHLVSHGNPSDNW